MCEDPAMAECTGEAAGAAKLPSRSSTGAGAGSSSGSSDAFASVQAASGDPSGATDPETLHLHLEPGATLKTPWGAFDIVGQVGSGTFSRIWRATFNCGEQRREVALKVYRAAASRGLVGTNCEARSLRSLQERYGVQPHVIEYLGYFYLPGTPAPHVVIVTELLGLSLLGHMHDPRINPPLREVGSCPQEERAADAAKRRKLAGAVLRDLLLALAKLERLGLAHCDVKPENILARDGDFEGEQEEKGEVQWKLTDFNHCRDCNTHITSPVLGRPWEVGTLWYNAPELLSGYSAAVAPTVDTWGLACSAAEIVCGGAPLFGAGAALGSKGKQAAAAYATLRQILTLTRQQLPDDVVSRSSCGHFFSKQQQGGHEDPVMRSRPRASTLWAQPPHSISSNALSELTSHSSMCHTPTHRAPCSTDSPSPSTCPSPCQSLPPPAMALRHCEQQQLQFAPTFACPPPPCGSLSCSLASSSGLASADGTPMITSPQCAPSVAALAVSPRLRGGWDSTVPLAPRRQRDALLPPEAAAAALGVTAAELTEEQDNTAYDMLFGPEVVCDFEGELFADLMRSLLCVDPAERLTATQALRHPFFNADKQGWRGRNCVVEHFRQQNRARHEALRTRYDLARAAQHAAKQVPPPLPPKTGAAAPAAAPRPAVAARREEPFVGEKFKDAAQAEHGHAQEEEQPQAPLCAPSPRDEKVVPSVPWGSAVAAAPQKAEDDAEAPVPLAAVPRQGPLAGARGSTRRPPPPPPPPARSGAPPPPPPGPPPQHRRGWRPGTPSTPVCAPGAPPPYPSLHGWQQGGGSSASSPAFRHGYGGDRWGGSAAQSPCRRSLSTPGLTPDSTPCRLSPPTSPVTPTQRSRQVQAAASEPAFFVGRHAMHSQCPSLASQAATSSVSFGPSTTSSFSDQLGASAASPPAFERFRPVALSDGLA
eukprot:TRINITY_DN31666_c0_g2_i1.p1 TRINITY_DN31666_c0_g2~~TRINITY_DN31666_c0_g2_i1.p1  ORF type:complete len:935 (+),score=263.08 TRINITY_DN31666_c0_g2_i1:134-2938(+)